MINWWNNGITLKCPNCDGNMIIYEGLQDIIRLKCEYENCGCEIELSGSVLFEGLKEKERINKAMKR